MPLFLLLLPEGAFVTVRQIWSYLIIFSLGILA
uniref:Uncharacterized protein n=1 Tax=Setaria italica TaxID=4555 RepID=K4A450_SETIT